MYIRAVFRLYVCQGALKTQKTSVLLHEMTAQCCFVCGRWGEFFGRYTYFQSSKRATKWEKLKKDCKNAKFQIGFELETYLRCTYQSVSAPWYVSNHDDFVLFSTYAETHSVHTCRDSYSWLCNNQWKFYCELSFLHVVYQNERNNYCSFFGYVPYRTEILTLILWCTLQVSTVLFGTDKSSKD